MTHFSFSPDDVVKSFSDKVLELEKKHGKENVRIGFNRDSGKLYCYTTIVPVSEEEQESVTSGKKKQKKKA